MSALSAAEAPLADEPGGPVTGPSVAGPRRRLRVAGPPQQAGGPAPSGVRPLPSGGPVPSPARPGARGGAAVPAVPRPARTGRVPIRLTRRGRRVAAGLIVAAAAVIALAAGLAAPGGAQASSNARSGGGHQGLHEIVVQPGQTLWSIASAAEPAADPREVVAEIMAANAMTGAVIETGQLLWVPR